MPATKATHARTLSVCTLKHLNKEHNALKRVNSAKTSPKGDQGRRFQSLSLFFLH